MYAEGYASTLHIHAEGSLQTYYMKVRDYTCMPRGPFKDNSMKAEDYTCMPMGSLQSCCLKMKDYTCMLRGLFKMLQRSEEFTACAMGCLQKCYEEAKIALHAQFKSNTLMDDGNHVSTSIG